MELSLTTTHRHLTPFPTTTTIHRRHHHPKSITFPKLTTHSSLHNPNSSSPSIQPIQPIQQYYPKDSKPTPPNSLKLLKTTFITGITVAAVFFSRFSASPVFAANTLPARAPPRTVETQQDSKPRLEINQGTKPMSQNIEKALEEKLLSSPEDDNIEVLKELMEVKIKNGKPQEAIGILNQLIDLEPEDSEWQLLKYHLHSYAGDHDSAKQGFEEIIKRDPLRVEAYHGLVMAASAKESPDELVSVEERIVEGIEICKKGKRKDDVRDFKLLLAQIRVIKSDYDDALKIYSELSKEEPRDFRPYLCQGIIYTLLGKNDEAEKYFEKYRRLVPKGHPYTKYFDDNMVATKVFAQKVEHERAYSKS